jgi:hypothetical protein
MKRRTVYIFETEEDYQMIRAVRKFIGTTSPAFRTEKGLTPEENELCTKFFDELGYEDEDEE